MNNSKDPLVKNILTLLKYREVSLIVSTHFLEIFLTLPKLITDMFCSSQIQATTLVWTYLHRSCITSKLVKM